MYLRYIHIQGSEERYLLGQNKTKPTNCRGNPFCQATKQHSTAKRSKTLAVILVSDCYFTQLCPLNLLAVFVEQYPGSW